MALVAEYGFNEGAGSVAADSSGNARNLTYSGSWEASARTGAGLGSGGAGAGPIGPNVASAVSIGAWVKFSLPAGGNYYGIATSATSSANGLYFEVSASGAALLLDVYNGTNTLNATSTFPVNTPTYVSCAVTTNSAALFINGVAAGSSGAGTTQNLGVADWRIGAGNGNIGPAAGDWIDEVRVDNTILNAAAFTTWMNTAVTGASSTPSRPHIIQRPAVIRAAYW